MRPEKANIVEDIVGRLNSSPFIFVTEYTGLRVAQFAELRNRLVGVGARCQVVRNTFLRRAVADAGLPEFKDLRGQTAIVTGDKDVAAAAKVLKTFAAEFKKPSVKAGIIDRLAVSGDQIQSIADLPSREVLLATLLGLLNQPATSLVRVLNEPASALARVLKAKVDAAGGAPAETPAVEEAPAAAPAGDAAPPASAAADAAPPASAAADEAPPAADAAPAPTEAPAA
jgi:large subunit ribosomal protein L10